MGMLVSQSGGPTMRRHGPFFYDLVRIVNFFKQEQALPLVYILENTYPGEKCTPAMTKAGELVQAFIGAPVVIDATDLEQPHIESACSGPTCCSPQCCKHVSRRY